MHYKNKFLFFYKIICFCPILRKGRNIICSVCKNISLTLSFFSFVVFSWICSDKSEHWR